MSTQCPLNIEMLDEELNQRLLKDFTGERTGFLQVGPDKWFLPSKYKSEANNFYNFKPRTDDIWVVTFPRSGIYINRYIINNYIHDYKYKKVFKYQVLDFF